MGNFDVQKKIDEMQKNIKLMKKETLTSISRSSSLGLRNNKGSYIKTECTVGDTVYVPFRDIIQEMTIIGIIYDGTLVYYKWNLKDDKGVFPWLDGFPEHNLGSTVFLSKEEAKKSTSLKNI